MHTGTLARPDINVNNIFVTCDFPAMTENLFNEVCVIDVMV